MATTHGVAYLFGVSGTVADAAVQSFQVKSENQSNASVTDEDGDEVFNRHDDLVAEGTITVKHTTTTFLTVEGTILYDGVTYRIISVDRNEVNNDFREVTYSIKNTQYVTLYDV